ncbi:cobalt ECF transporter T component CbiQ [Paenibacillus tarimensis]|uniref:cobalt ECF transporter T component CbiQ n=1 Tax=Paenibacillus tarimensis TaxID=416012 RepID=UPI001F22489B|nr:cobalt ECF transporter T component CbiQ [Paenibacillus tarimensis]MCF2944684.1 cobalt ECF transporter T component CbiQ [Paenibacillus tarimensis]
MIRQIDAVSHHNRLRPLPPALLCGFGALLGLGAYLSHPAVRLLILIWAAVWTIGYAGVPARLYMLMTGAACLFFAAGLPAIIVEIGSAAAEEKAEHFRLFHIYGRSIYLTSSGIQTAWEAFTRMLACLASSYMVILTVPVPELLAALKKLRVPSVVLDLIMIMYRFIFILWLEAADMKTAQQARGGHNGLKGRLNDTAMLAVHLFTSSMRRYHMLHQGLTARGYDGHIPLPSLRMGAIPGRYKLEIIGGVAVLLLLEITIRLEVWP